MTNLTATAETNTEGLIWHHSWGHQPATWWQGDYIELLLFWKGQHVALIGIDTLDTDLSSLYVMLPPNLPLVDLESALSSVMVLHAALLLI